jgi:hypothetical protein
MMEADMKKFIMAAMLAAVVTVTTSAPVTSGFNSQADGSFVTAQRYCPNGRC